MEWQLVIIFCRVVVRGEWRKECLGMIKMNSEYRQHQARRWFSKRDLLLIVSTILVLV